MVLPASNAPTARRRAAGWIPVGIICVLAIGMIADHLWIALALFVVTAVFCSPPVDRRLGEAGLARKWRVAIDAALALLALTVLAITEMPSATVPRTEGETAAVARAPAGDQKAELIVQTKALWERIDNQTAECDAAANQVAKALRSGSASDVNPIANQAADVCKAAGDAIGQETPPDAASEEARDDFANAISSCSQGYSDRSASYSTLVAASGADRRTSPTDAKATLDAANSGALQCASGMFEAATKAGIDPSFTGTAPPERSAS